MNDTQKLYKLIILYMLEQVNFPLDNSQISEFILEKEYTTYFTLQEVISDCIDSNLVRAETTYQRTTYFLTEDGSNTIKYFKGHLSPSIQSDIDAHLKAKQYELRSDSDISADYYPNSNEEYSVKLQIKEKNFPLIDLTMSVPTEAIAEQMANNWAKNNQEVYAIIMEHLLK